MDLTAFTAAIDNLAHMVEQHGISLILLIIILFWLFPKINFIWKQQVEIRGRRGNESVEATIKFNIATKALLREAMLNLKADWCTLWQFHNGTYSIGKNHLPFMYLSVTHEVHTPGMKPMLNTFHSIPLAMIDTGVLQQFIAQQTVIHIANMSKARDELTGMASLMGDLNANTGAMIPIRDEDGLLCAIFSVSFTTVVQLTPQNLTDLTGFARRMAWQMANSETIIEKDDQNATLS
jgi:hypothetical protein